MKRRLSLFSVALAACLAAGCATQRMPARTSEFGSFHKVPIGLCEDYPKDSRSLAAARNDLELLKTNGIHVLRISFSWLDMEPELGKYDWSFWDDFVRMAHDEYDVRLIPYICYTPRWASTSTNNDYWQKPPANNGQFAEFVTELVRRYQKRIHSWEIWNEPDNAYYWRGSPKQFADLLDAGAKAVRKADPDATVVMGGLAWNPEFVETMLASPAISNIDVINLHNYYETWASEPLERIPDYIGRAADLIHQNGQHQPIWLAEVGYSDFRRGAYVSDQYVAHFENEHTPEAQAASLFRVMALALTSGKVSLVAWYRIHDLPMTQGVIGDENNRHLGILDTDDRAKPALRALQFFDSLFPNGSRCIDDEVRVTKRIGSPIEVHAFQRSDGSLVIIAWQKDYIPGLAVSSHQSLIPDQRVATIDLELPFLIKDKGVNYDDLGKLRGKIAVSHHGRTSRISCEVKNGTVTVLQVASFE
jgi:hypothetical protein